MPYILDDTEVNTPVYDKLLRLPRMRKLKRPVLAVRVRQLEVSFRLLQDRLFQSSVTDVQIPQPELLKIPTSKAKTRVRRSNSLAE